MAPRRGRPGGVVEASSEPGRWAVARRPWSVQCWRIPTSRFGPSVPGAGAFRYEGCGRCRRRSELTQHGFRVAHLELAGLLDIQSFDEPILDEHGVAQRADTHATCGQILVKSEGLGIGRAAVGHHADLARGLLRLPPRAHHKGVVDRQAPHLVHALGPDLVMVRDVTGHVLGRACRRKGAGQAEDDDALALGESERLKALGPIVHPGVSCSINSVRIPSGNLSPILIVTLFLPTL